MYWRGCSWRPRLALCPWFCALNLETAFRDLVLIRRYVWKLRIHLIILPETFYHTLLYTQLKNLSVQIKWIFFLWNRPLRLVCVNLTNIGQLRSGVGGILLFLHFHTRTPFSFRNFSSLCSTIFSATFQQTLYWSAILICNSKSVVTGVCPACGWIWFQLVSFDGRDGHFVQVRLMSFRKHNKALPCFTKRFFILLITNFGYYSNFFRCIMNYVCFMTIYCYLHNNLQCPQQ